MSPDVALGTFEHTAFAARDDVPKEVAAIAQTTDGLLWLAGERGLTFYDGTTFRPFIPAPGEALSSGQLNSLQALPDGSLAMTYMRLGLSVLKDGHLTHYSKDIAPGSSSLAGTYHGQLWMFSVSSVDVLDHGTIRHAAEFSSAPRISFVAVDPRQGNVWMGRGGRMAVLRQGGKGFEDRGPVVDKVNHATFDARGILLVSARDGVHLYDIEGDKATARPYVLPVSAGESVIDRRGHVWLATRGSGVRYYPALPTEPLPGETMDHDGGLTAAYTYATLEDREGNIWVGTQGGLDRFRQTPFTRLVIPNGMHTVAVAPTGNGVWLGSENLPLTWLGAKTIPVMTAVPKMALALFPTGDTVLAASPKTLFEGRDGQVRQIASLPFDDFVGAIARDNEGRTYAFEDADRSAVAVLNGTTWSSIPTPYGAKSLTPAPDGGMWVGGRDNHLLKWGTGVSVTYDSRSGLSVGMVRVVAFHNDMLWVAGSDGINVLDNGHFARVTLKDHPTLDVTGLVFDRTGALWVHALEGLARVDPGDVATAERATSDALPARWFSAADGVIGSPSVIYAFPSLRLDDRGRLWVQNTASVASIDPARVAPAASAPPVKILGVSSGGRALVGSGPLPIGPSRDMQVDYTSPALGDPASIRFRYRLDGVDEDWQNVGARRVAFYTSLPAGMHLFHVEAGNGDGHWTSEAAVLVQVRAHFYETLLFRLLVVLALVLALWGAWRIRLQQVTSALRIRMDEREVVARDIHDTILQAAQAMVLKLDVMATHIGNDDERRELASLADYARRSVDEGRTQLERVRVESKDDFYPVAALLETASELSLQAPTEFTWRVEGKTVPMNPVVGGQVRAIVCEMLTNAFRHAGAPNIHLHVDYGVKAFRISVRDDGKGIIADPGRGRHFGLRGMKERAMHCGGSLLVDSTLGGTTIGLALPAKRVYLTSARKKGPR
ncbi:sensor histidine kinase [Luteibacter pinisoli]|nr:sensor histidine kinase [Luteibacter pinisoli]